MSNALPSRSTRRQFLKGSLAASAFSLATPYLARARQSDARPILGSGEHQYEVDHHWAQLPDRFQWQTTHNVAVDQDGLVYVIHEGRDDLPDHPAIFVFDPDGRYVRSFGQQFQGGGHGLDIRREGDGQQYLYVTAYKRHQTFAKLDLKGEQVWSQGPPPEAMLYNDKQRFQPTNFAFAPDGGFYVADGYGQNYIHHLDQNGRWLRCWGGPGEQPGKFRTPHGLWIDARPGREPSVVVADRANKRLQWFTLAGKHLHTLDGFLFPANIDTRGDVMLVPDLHARVSLLDGNNRVIAHLGDDPAWTAEVTKFKIRNDEATWQAGRFVHPHDACFDAEGNIYVTEWVRTGRVTKLRKLA